MQLPPPGCGVVRPACSASGLRARVPPNAGEAGAGARPRRAVAGDGERWRGGAAMGGVVMGDVVMGGVVMGGVVMGGVVMGDVDGWRVVTEVGRARGCRASA